MSCHLTFYSRTANYKYFVMANHRQNHLSICHFSMSVSFKKTHPDGFGSCLQLPDPIRLLSQSRLPALSGMYKESSGTNFKEFLDCLLVCSSCAYSSLNNIRRPLHVFGGYVKLLSYFIRLKPDVCSLISLLISNAFLCFQLL